MPFPCAFKGILSVLRIVYTEIEDIKENIIRENVDCRSMYVILDFSRNSAVNTRCGPRT